LWVAVPVLKAQGNRKIKINDVIILIRIQWMPFLDKSIPDLTDKDVGEKAQSKITVILFTILSQM